MGIENNKNIKNFLDDILTNIKNKDVHNEVKMELESHILEIADEFIDSGLSEENSIKEALKRMGNPTKIGNKLNKIHKPKPDYITLLLSLGLFIIGIVIMSSLRKSNVISFNALSKNILAAVLGLVVGVSIYKFDYRKLKNYGYHMYFFNLLMLIIIGFFDFDTYGVHTVSRSISLLSSTVFLVSLCSIIQSLDLSKLINKLILIVLSIIPIIIQLVIPNLTMALFFIFTINMIFLISNASKLFKISIISIESLGFIAFLIKMLSIPHLRDRLYAFLPALFKNHPASYLQDQSMKLLNNATLFGQDISKSNIDTVNLHNDLIFTAIVYSLGWAVAIVCLLMITAFIVRNSIIIFKVKDYFGKSIMISIVSLFSLQFITTILFALGLSPFTFGIPFISSGGMNMFTNCILISILSSVYRRRTLTNIIC